MTRYLKMIGNIVLYLAIYIAISIIVNLTLGLAFRNTNVISWILSNMSIVTIITNIPTILVYMLISKIMKQDFSKKYNFNTFNYNYTYLLALIGISLGVFSISFLKINAIHEAFPLLAAILDSIVSGKNLIIIVLGTITMGTILEEVLFRGLVFDELKVNMNIVLAVILQGLIFGALTLNIPVMLYAGMGGMIYGVVYIIFNSMWASIIAHFLSSATLLVLSKWGVNLITGANAVYVSLGSFIVLAVSLYLLIRSKHKIQSEKFINASNEQVNI
ncbi:MAG: type II CAAX endopeptidase family protein [Lutisporaceae bacterium]